MFDVEIRTKITYDSDTDKTELRITRNTLEKLADLFAKSGNGCTTEIELLKGAAHTVDEILRGETF